MESTPVEYMAFLLRLWRVNTDRGSAWRASLEDPCSGIRRGFADLEAVLVYLVEQCREKDGDAVTPVAGRRHPR